MNKQKIDIAEIMYRSQFRSRGEMALAMYSRYGWTDSYCRYRLSFITNGKTHMTIADLRLMKEVTGLEYTELLEHIFESKTNSKTNKNKNT